MRRQTASSHCWRALLNLLITLQYAGAGLAVAVAVQGISDARVEERLGDANAALTKAMPGSNVLQSTGGTAKPTAFKGVNEAQLLLSSKDMQAARGSVTAGRQSNVPHHSSPGRQDLMYFTLEAEKALKDVEALVHIADNQKNDYNPKPKHGGRSLMVLESSNVTADSAQPADPKGLQLQGRRLAGSQSCKVDGTACQFSGCAQGRNLVSCSIGFAKGVVGGYYGQSYTVTSDQDHPDNPPPGTLRYGLNLARNVQGGVWITFSRDLTIELRAMLWVHSHTTVDGRGFNVTIHQHSVVMSGAKQVILENIQVNSVRGGDTVHIFSGCSKVWVDHITSFGGDLGLVSVVQGSTDVTISNCKLSNHNFNMLLGASDNDDYDKNMRVSVFRNHFLDSMQRMPHCRWGWCHVSNNLYTNWGYYAIGARVNGRVKSENNVFVPGRVNEVTPWHPGAEGSNSFDFSARIESKGDILTNGATFHQFLKATHDVRPPYLNGEYPPLIQADKVRNLVNACAGAQPPKILYSCLRAAGA